MKTWRINAGGSDCEIGLKGRSVVVNGQTYSLNSLPKTNKAFLFYEYQLPVEGAEVLLVTGLWAMELVVDGAYLNSGKPYVPLGKIPGWAWVFVVLNAFNLMLGGAIGGLAGAIGAIFTLRVAGNPDMSTAAKVGISFALWVGCSAVMWILALLVTFALA